MNLDTNSTSVVTGTSNVTRIVCPRFDWFAIDVEHPAYLCQLCAITIGLVLNGLTMGVFSTGKEFKGAPFVFMWALALSDICNLVVKWPECFVMATREKTKDWPFLKDIKLYMYYMWSNYLNPIGNITENISVWLIVCLALERYISMKHYNISKTYCSSRNAVLVTLSILGIAGLINLFSFFGMRAYYGHDGNETFVGGRASHFYSTVWYEICVWLRACAAQFLPLVFLAVANCRLIFALRRQSRKMKKYSQPQASAQLRLQQQQQVTSPVKRSSVNSRRHAAQRRLTVMLVVVIGLVLFGQIPQAFSFHKLFSLIFRCPSGCPLDRCLIYRKYKLLANTPNLLCYSCNFFIYFGLNKHFRGHVIRLFTCRCCCCYPPEVSGRRNSGATNNNGLYTAVQPDRTGTGAAATTAAVVDVADASDADAELGHQIPLLESQPPIVALPQTASSS